MVDTVEVVLSDSASTDRTIEIARRFPITIVQLLPDWPRSPGAGRHVGFRHARGSLILFVDGDYVLAEDWLPEAVRTLRGQPEVAAVCGTDTEETTGESVLQRFQKHLLESSAGEPEAIPVGLYRRSALEQVGGFHPFLRGAEDRDLAFRLRAAGYRLLRLSRKMGIHRWADRGPLDYVTYFRSVFSWSIGDGQLFRGRRAVPRVARDMRLRYANIRHLENYLLTLVVAILVLSAAVAIIVPSLQPLLFLYLAFGLVLERLRRTRGWSRRETAFMLHVIPYSVIRHAGFVIGFLRKPRSPSEYPRGELVLQSSGRMTAP